MFDYVKERMNSTLPLILGLLALLLLAACGDGSVQPSGPPSGRIAFTSDRDGNEEIYVMDADGSGQTNLTMDPSDDNEPWWSPDGERIAFVSLRDGSVNIHIMNAQGDDVQQLTDSPAVDGGLRWSPDGSKVAFYGFEQQARGFMWVADADLGERQAVLEGIHPAGPEVDCAGGFPGGWFPDGERLVFRGSNGATRALQICSAKIDGSDIQVIFSEPDTQNSQPAISPDGKKVAFTSNRDGDFNIYTVDVDGDNLFRVADDDAKDSDPVWSPDGGWIAFSSTRDGDAEIYIVRPNGEDLRQLTDNPADETQPAWSQ